MVVGAPNQSGSLGAAPEPDRRASFGGDTGRGRRFIPDDFTFRGEATKHGEFADSQDSRSETPLDLRSEIEPGVALGPFAHG